MKLNKKDWKEYLFGDVTIQQKETVDRENTTLDKYIAGEHMATEDIHIRQWGTVGDDYLGPAFHRKFCKNDILYGSRRTYLKKVAIAHFEGITANTTFVIKLNERLIDLRLLPFLMLSDSFTDHSVRNSKGSVNPYINWKDIANYKFKLPSLDGQKRLADLLWSVDGVIESYSNLLKKLIVTRNSLLKQNHRDMQKEPQSISHIAEINPRIDRKNIKKDKLVSFITMADISEEGYIINKEDRKYSEVEKGFTPFEDGDILFAKITPCMENGKGAIASGLTNGLGFGSTEFHVIRPKDKDDRYYLYCLTRMFHLRKKAEQLMTGSVGQKRVPSDLFDFYKINLPEKRKRKNIGDQLRKYDYEIERLKKSIATTKNIQKQIINQIFR